MIIALFSTVTVVNAQSKNDPSYSTNNYKHLNKAIEAKEIKNEGVANEGYVKEENIVSRNYKMMNNQSPESGAIILTPVIEKDIPALASSRNYKSSFGKKSNASAGSQEILTPVVAEK